jgi:hypothetical protein
MKTYIPIVALAVFVGACGSSSPTQPSAAPSPSPTPSSATNWIVTQTFVSVEGPDNCWIREQRQRWTGAVFPGLSMSITRSDGSIRLESSWFQVNYAGTYSGSNFADSGVSPLEGGGRPCVDGALFQQQPGISNLTGRFSDDDQSLTADEVNSYRLTTGEPVTYRWAWKATRQN